MEIAAAVFASRPVGYDHLVTTEHEAPGTTPAAVPPAVIEEYDDGFGFETSEPEPLEPVSPLIAVIRIVSVLGMGLFISFGLFISLVGVQGLLIGIPCLLMAIPCFYGMQMAERWAQRQAKSAAERET